MISINAIFTILITHWVADFIFQTDCNPQLISNFINAYWNISIKTNGLLEDNK